MANALTKDLEIMFGEFVDGYDSATVMSNECETSFPSPQAMQRAGDTFYVPQSYNATVTTGLDISGASDTDVIQRVVPTVYRQPDNVRFSLDAKEMRDPETMKRMGEAASLRLAAEIENNVNAAVTNRASIVVKKVGAFTWDDGLSAEQQMLIRGVGMGRTRKLFMNPTDYVQVAKDLGNRQYMADINKSAYERSQVPGIGGFRTFRLDMANNVAAVGTVSGTTINGNQSYTPSAMTGDVPTDNRQMVLNVSGANIANIKAGDSFVVAGVNSTHQINKTSTGSPLTFRVISVAGGGANLTVSPPIITSGPYQNATAQAANGAAITFLNTVTAPSNVFWADGSVGLDYGRLAFPSGQGAQVMTSTTKNGVPLTMAYEFNSLTAKTTVRFSTIYAVTVRDPEQVGIILANQT
jgi:hypothetical protein